jgi:CheY-like chemotaxis protein/HPt (histidine-containing phosphotransfer) domain-containing protein
VDDSWTALEHLEQQLVAWGISAATVGDADRALLLLQAAAAAGEPYDLALIDYQMPGMDGLELGRRIKTDPAIAGTRLVLVTAVGARGQARAAEDAGFAAFLTKPLRQSALHDCLALVAGAGAAAPGRPAPRAPLITRHTLAEARGAGRARILVAEDNPVNQRVAVGLLERFGYRADVVGTGAEAVEAVAHRPYDLVLLDCQMPVMDGYEAAARIRKSEPADRRMPIVAMTADAMAADRDRCLAAGMDDHVAKPVDLRQLHEVLQRWLPDTAAAAEGPAPADDIPAPPPPAASDPGLIDLSQLKSILGEDPGARQRFLELYLKTAAALVQRAGGALAARDDDSLRRLAHSLKGSSGNVGAIEVARLATELERVAGAADWPAAESCCRSLETAFARTVTHARSIAP